MPLPINNNQIAKTTEQWKSLNPVLAVDVIGIEVMSNGYNRFKRGNGKVAWNALPYLDKVYNMDYAANAGNADTVDNKHASDFLGVNATAANSNKLGGLECSRSGNRHDVVPWVAADGCMEVGKHIDFHESDSETKDFTHRLSANVIGIYQYNAAG